MEIAHIVQPNLPTIEAYTAGEIVVSGQAFQQPILMGKTVQMLPETWLPEQLTIDDFQAAIDDGADVILVGTGEKQVFLSPKLAAQLAQLGMGLECMHTAAACRTYMLLQSEGRQVYAWLLV